MRILILGTGSLAQHCHALLGAVALSDAGHEVEIAPETAAARDLLWAGLRSPVAEATSGRYDLCLWGLRAPSMAARVPEAADYRGLDHAAVGQAPEWSLWLDLARDLGWTGYSIPRIAGPALGHGWCDVAIAPAADSPRASWPYWHYLAERLSQRGLMVGLVGDHADYVHASQRPYDVAAFMGRSPSDLVSDVAASSLVIGGDCAAIHIAGVLDLPAIGMYGPTDWIVGRPASDRVRVFTAPSRIRCAPCGEDSDSWHACIDPCCMRAIDLDRIEQAALAILAGDDVVDDVSLYPHPPEVTIMRECIDATTGKRLDRGARISVPPERAFAAVRRGLARICDGPPEHRAILRPRAARIVEEER